MYARVARILRGKLAVKAQRIFEYAAVAVQPFGIPRELFLHQLQIDLVECLIRQLHIGFRLQSLDFLIMAGLFRHVLSARGTKGLPRGQHGSNQQGHSDGAGSQEEPAVLEHEFAEPISCGRWHGHYGFAIQKPQDIGRQSIGRLVAARAVFFERLHDDPVQIAPYQTRQLCRRGSSLSGNRRQGIRGLRQTRTGFRWLFLANDPQHLVPRRRPQPLFFKRRRTGQQFIQEHSQ